MLVYRPQRLGLWPVIRRVPAPASIRTVASSPPKLPYQLDPAAHRTPPEAFNLSKAKQMLHVQHISLGDPQGYALIRGANSRLAAAHHTTRGGELSMVVFRKAVLPQLHIQGPKTTNAAASDATCLPPEALAARVAAKAAKEAAWRRRGDGIWSLATVLSIKNLTKSALTRTRLRKRIVRAVRLVSQHGAVAVHQPGGGGPEGQPNALRFDPQQAAVGKYIDPDCVYVLRPQLSLNGLSLPQLVDLLRKALLDLARTLANPAAPKRPGLNHPARGRPEGRPQERLPPPPARIQPRPARRLLVSPELAPSQARPAPSAAAGVPRRLPVQGRAAAEKSRFPGPRVRGVT